MKDYGIKIIDTISIYKDDSLYIKGKFSGFLRSKITYYENEKLIFQLTIHSFGFKKWVKVIYQGLLQNSIEIKQDRKSGMALRYQGNTLSYRTSLFKKKFIKFYFNNEEIGYAKAVEDKKIFQPGGKYEYKINLESDDELLNLLFLILFTGTYIRFF